MPHSFVPERVQPSLQPYHEPTVVRKGGLILFETLGEGAFEDRSARFAAGVAKDPAEGTDRVPLVAGQVAEDQSPHHDGEEQTRVCVGGGGGGD